MQLLAENAQLIGLLRLVLGVQLLLKRLVIRVVQLRMVQVYLLSEQ